MRTTSSNTDCSGHLGRHDGTCQNSTTDGDIAHKWTLFVDVFSVDRFSRSFEAKANLFEPSLWLCAGLLGLLGVEEDVRLLLESTLRLNG